MFNRTKLDIASLPGPGDEMLTLWGVIAERIEYLKVTIRYKHEVEAYTI